MRFRSLWPQVTPEWRLDLSIFFVSVARGALFTAAMLRGLLTHRPGVNRDGRHGTILWRTLRSLRELDNAGHRSKGVAFPANLGIVSHPDSLYMEHHFLGYRISNAPEQRVEHRNVLERMLHLITLHCGRSQPATWGPFWW